MKCQHCGKNEATMSLRFQVNQQGMQINMCHTCFQEIQSQLMQARCRHLATMRNQFFQANGGQQARTQTKQTEENQGNGLLDQLGKNIIK